MTYVQDFHENNLITWRVGTHKTRVRYRVGDLLNTSCGRITANLNKTVWNELINGGKRHASHGTRRLLALDDLKKGRQKCARVYLIEIRVIIEQGFQIIEVFRKLVLRLVLSNKNKD